MKYVTTDVKAKEWEISNRRVQILCAQGRVNGAIKQGGIWMIPEFAIKPLDKRNCEEQKNDENYSFKVTIEVFGECQKIKYMYEQKIQKEEDINKKFYLKYESYLECFYIIAVGLETLGSYNISQYIGKNVLCLNQYANNLITRKNQLEKYKNTESIESEKKLIELFKNIYEFLNTCYCKGKNIKEKYICECVLKYIEKSVVDNVNDENNIVMVLSKEYIKSLIDKENLI